MGLIAIIKRVEARLRRQRPEAVEREPIPRVELWEFWEGADDDMVLDVLEGIRQDMTEDAEEMQRAFRQPN